MFRSLFGNRIQAREAEEAAQNSYQPQRTAVKQLSPHDLQTWLDDAGPSPLLVDVRTPAEFEYDGRIANSLLIPLDSLMQRMKELPKDQPIVCVCRSGSRSYMACELLAAQGYDATNLAGGMIAWKRSGLPYE